MTKDKVSTIWVAIGFSIAFMCIWTVSHELSASREERLPLYFEWESNIRFQWWAMPIYFSLDLAVTLFPLWFKNWKEALAPMLTLLAQTLIAAPLFIFIPIAVGYENTLDGGIWGHTLFNPIGAKNISLWNHAPSLHVAYVFTIAFIISNKKSVASKCASYFWAVLVSVSTMLVHEHHLICVTGGFILFAGTILTIYPTLERKFAT